MMLIIAVLDIIYFKITNSTESIQYFDQSSVIVIHLILSRTSTDESVDVNRYFFGVSWMFRTADPFIIVCSLPP